MFISDLKASVAEAKEAPEGKGTMVALYGTCSRFVICGVAPRRWTLYVPISPLFVPTADSIPVSRFVQVLEARAPSDRPSWKKWRVSFWIHCTRRDAGDGGAIYRTASFYVGLLFVSVCALSMACRWLINLYALACKDRIVKVHASLCCAHIVHYSRGRFAQ